MDVLKVVEVLIGIELAMFILIVARLILYLGEASVPLEAGVVFIVVVALLAGLLAGWLGNLLLNEREWVVVG